MEYDELFEETQQLALNEVIDVGVRQSSYHPPIYKFYHVVGVAVRLPHYNGFLTNIWVFGLPLSLILLFPVLLTFLPMGFIPGLIVSLGVTVLCAGVSGLLLAIYYKLSARIYRLSTWDELRAQIAKPELYR